MANINCSFSKFNDLLGIQQVISLSIVNSLPFSEVVESIKDNYLNKIYGSDLSGLGSKSDIGEALFEVGEAIKLVVNSIEEHDPTRDEANNRIQSKLELLGVVGDQEVYFENYESIIDNIIQSWHNEHNVLELDTQEGVIKPEQKPKDTYVDLVYSVGGNDINKVVLPMNSELVDVSKPLTVKEDLAYSYFKGASSAHTRFIQNFTSNLIERAIITTNAEYGKPKVITSNEEIDKNIKDWKETLFKKLFPEEGDLYVDLGSDKVIRPDYDELLSDLKAEYESKEIGVRDLIEWLESKPFLLDSYFSYLTLINFDKMIELFGSSLVDVKKNLVDIKGESYNTIKYFLQGSNALSKNWSDNDLRDTFVEQSPIYKLIIENTTRLAINGASTNRFLKTDAVAAYMSKITPLIDRTDMMNSMKEVLEDVLMYRYNRSKASEYSDFYKAARLSDSDYSVFLSLYVKFFKNKDYLSNGKLNNFLKDINKFENVGENIANQEVVSYYEVFNDFANSAKFDLDIFKVIPANIIKTVQQNYSEIGWDAKTKGMSLIELSSKASDKQASIFKTKLNGKANFINQAAFDKFLSDFGVEVNDSKIYFPHETGKFYYDVLDNVFVDESGTSFDLATILSPNTNVDLIDPITDELDPQYTSYHRLVQIIARVMDEPLTAFEYKSLFQFKARMDAGKVNNHLEALLKIASSIIYTQNNKLKYMKDVKDVDAMRAKLPVIPRLVNDQRRADTLIDARWRSLRVDITKPIQSAIMSYGEMLSEERGTDVKAVTIDSNGNALPVYGMISAITDFNNVKRHVKDQPGFENSPLYNNPFIQNELLDKLVIRSNVKNNDGVIKSSSKLDVNENSVYDIVYEYLNAKGNPEASARNPKFQPTVFADKSKHTSIQINGEFRFRRSDAMFSETILNKKYSEFDAQDFREIHYKTQKDYYTKLQNQLLNTYNSIFIGQLAPITTSYLNNNTKILSKVLEGFEMESNVEIQPHELVYNRSLYAGKTLYEEIDNYNKLVKAFTQGVSTIDEANSILNILGEAAFLESAKRNLNSEISQVVKEIVYVKNKSGSIGVNDTIMDFIDTYVNEEKYDAMMQEAKEDFMANLDKFGVKLELYNVDNKRNEVLANALKAFGISENSDWIDNSTGFIKLRKGDQLNPMLEQYFWEFNAITENFQNATVGTINGHAAKGKHKSIKQVKAAKLVAMYKRMVAHQATFHPYALNIINGVPFYNKVAYVKDPSKELFNQIGETTGQDVTDGSTITNLLHRFLENNSLLDQRGAIHHKSIGTTVNRFFSAAGLMKHAAHGITNERLRYSHSAENSLKNIVKKMLNENFNINGIEVNFDLTTDYNGNAITMDSISKGKGVYYTDLNKNLYEVVNFELVDPAGSVYNVTERLVSPTGNDIFETKTVTINNLYDLWDKVLGGGTDTTPGFAERSVHYSEKDLDSTTTNIEGYVFGNSSWEHLAAFVNSVGFRMNKESFETLSQKTMMNYEELRAFVNKRLNRPNDQEFSNNAYPEQTSVYQPLKHHYIAQITFDSGQKVGGQNMNNSKILNRNNNEPLWVSDYISNLGTGIQLDYEHEADESDVTEMSQIISALAFNGDTPEYAENVYKAIANYIEVNMAGVLPFITRTDSRGRSEFYNYVAKELVRNFETKDTVSLANIVMYKVKDELVKQKKILNDLVKLEPESIEYADKLKELEEFEENSFKTPFSDPNIYGVFFNTISNLFTKEGVRRKLPGIAAIISPHSSMVEKRHVPIFDENGNEVGMKVVNDEGYNSWKNQLKKEPWFQNLVGEGGSVEQTILNLQNKTVDADDVSLFDTVTHNGKTERLDTYAKYKRFKNNVSGEVTLNRSATRDLKPAEFTWNIGNSGRKFSIYDLPNTQLSFLIREIESLSKKVKGYGKLISVEGLSGYEIENLYETVENDISTLANLVEEYNGLVVKTNVDLDLIDGEINNIEDEKDNIVITNTLELPSFDSKTFLYLKNRIRKDYHEISSTGRVPLTTEQIDLIDTLPEKFINIFGDEAAILVADYNSYKEQVGNDENALANWIRTTNPKLTATNIESSAAEIALPKIYKTKFDLSQDDMISDINSTFFIDKLNKKSLPEAGIVHDFYIRSYNGKHIYVYLKDSENHKKVESQLENLDIETLNTKDKDGNLKTFRVDDNGHPMYEISNTEFKTFTINGRKHEVVLIDGFDNLVDLEKIIKDKESSYIDVVTNYTAGLNVAQIGLTYAKRLANDANVSAKIDAKLKYINSLASAALNPAEGVIEEISDDESLLLEYDVNWVNEQLEILQSAREDATEEVDKRNINYKIGIYQDYLTNLLTLNSGDESVRNQTIKQAQAIHDKLLSKYKKKGTAVDRLTQKLERENEYQFSKIAKRNERLGRERYSSFKMSLNFTVARIPGQGMQSFMPMKVAFFLDTEENTALVTPYNLWLTGGDFDIDKIYAVGYSFDNNGKLIGWHPEFNYKNEKTLEKSLELPVSDNKKREFSMFGGSNILSLNIEDLNIVNNHYANKAAETTADFIKFVDIMKKLSQYDKYTVVGIDESMGDLLSEFEVNINGDKDKIGYFNQPLNLRNPVEATLNIIAANMFAAIKDPRNAVHAFAPVDMNAPKEAAEKSPKGEEVTNISSNDPFSINMLKVANMVGKEVIGIAATGLKVYSALATRYMRAGKGDMKNLPFVTQIQKYLLENGQIKMSDSEIITIIASINFDGKEQYLTQYLEKALEGYSVVDGKLTPETEENVEGKKQYIAKILKDQEIKGDAALVLSALLSAATDNAKELILGKINAGPETAGLYAYAIIMGVNFSDFANMMISREVQTIIDLSKRNVFDYSTKKRSLNKAVQIIQNGHFNPEDYLSNDAITIVAKGILDDINNGNLNLTINSKYYTNAVQLIQQFLKLATPELLSKYIGRFQDSVKLSENPFIEGKLPKEVNIEDELENTFVEDSFIEDIDAVEAEDNFDEEFLDEDDQNLEQFSSRPNIVALAKAFNRMMVDSIDLKSKLNGLDMSPIKTFSQVMKGADAITTLGAMLSVNQSIKSNPYDLYKYFNKLERHVNGLLLERAKNIDIMFPNNEIVSNGFDAKRFALDPIYKDKAVQLYEFLKSDINILEVLSSVEHFNKMFQLAVHAHNLDTRASVKHRMVDYLIDELSKRDILPTSVKMHPNETDVVLKRYKGTLSAEDYNKLSSFIDDLLIVNFLGSANLKFKVKAGDFTTNDAFAPIQAASDYVIGLNSVAERTKFTTWFETTVLSDLKAGNLRDANGNYLETGNKELRDNYFLTQFNLDQSFDSITKAPFLFYKLPVNMAQVLSEDDKLIFDAFKVSFYHLKNFNYAGYNVVDLLYLYNLIVHKNRVTGSSLNRLFESVVDLNQSSVIQQHLKFIGELDRDVDVLRIGDYFKLEDVIEKGIAREIDRLPRPEEQAVRPSIVKVKGFENGRRVDTYYKFEYGIYQPLNFNRLALDKNIRISNGSKQLTTMVEEGKLVSVKSRLKALFDAENVEISKIDETCE